MKTTEYFQKFNLEESDVVKFEYETADNTVTLIFCTSFPHNYELMTPDERKKFKLESPIDDYHKLVFAGVSNYKREAPISPTFKELDSFEETPNSDLVLVMYGVVNQVQESGSTFSAVLSGFGEISFHYAELSVEFKRVIEKSVNGINEDRLYIDVETARVAHMPQLFDANNINVGDIVHLKSGGPDMTVRSLNRNRKNRLAYCVWFDKNRRQSNEFPFELLEISDLATSKGKPVNG